ncbi:MAG: ADOP family duplicated permease [Vicinamibacterales bacterium]
MRATPSFEGLGGYIGRNLTLSHDGAAERVRGGSVTPDLFPLLGVSPVLGRHFRDDEAAPPGLERVVLLTHGLWQRRYGGDAGIVGRDVHVNGLPRTVVGVLPPGFRFPERDDLYLPLAWDESPRDARGVNGIGALREGASLTEARDQASAIAARLARDHVATNDGYGVHVQPYRETQIDRTARGLSLTLLAAVALVLLVACANLANLMLVRASGRQREMAVRSALGAGRGRLVRLLLVETGLVSVAGAVVGLLGAAWTLDLLLASFPEELPYWIVFDVDRRIAAFTVLLTALTTVGVGLMPAVRASRPHLVDDLKDGARGTPAGEQRLHAALVVAQVAVSLALLVGASMMIRGFLAMQTTDLGFDHRALVSLRVYLAGDALDALDARARAVEELAAAVAAMPGVTAAAATTAIPGDDGGGLARVVVDGRTTEAEAIGAQVVGATDGLFTVLGRELVGGRGLTAAEARDPAARVAVINAALAERLWPDGSALDRRIGVRSRGAIDWYRVVGVAPDVHYEEIGEDTPQSRLTLYVPHAVTGYRTMAVLARAAGDPDTLVVPLQDHLSARFPEQPIYELMTMNQRRRFVTWEDRFMGQMMGTFAALAVGLAGLGVYALLAYAVRRRLPEIGVRLALGAAPGDIVRLVVGQGVAVAAVGLGLGLVLAAALAAVIQGFVFGGDAWDPRHLATAAAVLAAAVLTASYLPARRAARTDPTVALRSE